MISIPIISIKIPFIRSKNLVCQANLNDLAQQRSQLPRFVKECPVAMRYLDLLSILDWQSFPERKLDRNWGQEVVPYAPFVAACLVKIDQGLTYMSQLRTYLVEHPSLVWILGFQLAENRSYPWGFDPAASLPTHRHFTRMLRTTPAAVFQSLLDSSIRQLQAELRDENFGECISLDTKHIIAWVKENNPKQYVGDRYDKTKQPKGDPDCKLGCKRKHNQKRKTEGIDTLPTPITNPHPADLIEVGEYYWGYGSGVVATQTQKGEFILAELTQTFDQPDVSYFQPLMADVECRLGRKPRFGAFDAAFDAFYVYEYFYNAHGFAAVPLTQRGPYSKRNFSEDGLPICEAGLPMPLIYTFRCKTARVPHERGRFGCPYLYPQPTQQTCPKQHKNWCKGGCVTTMATSPGARLRYQLDRESEEYKNIYRQRTATERVNSQAKELGIERPHIRNGQAIANFNTLIYVLINLRALQRIRSQKM